MADLPPKIVQQTVAISDVNQVTPAWLTAVLQREGALTHGHVIAAEKSTLESRHSHIWQLSLKYSKDAAGARPLRLLLKLVDEADFGASEVTYYRHDYRGLPHAPLVRCYDAAYTDRPSAHYHLLLDDHSETHQVQWHIPPTQAYGSSLARALSTLHAHWWDKVPGAVFDVDRLWQYAINGLEPMLQHAAGDIPSSWPAQIRKLCESVPEMMRQRLANGRHLTLLHGDVNPGNILAPTTGDGPLYLLDRQPFDWSLMHWIGPSDLAYALVLWWEPALWQQWLPDILHTYHAEVLQHGIDSYTLQDARFDFRLGVAQCLTVPLAWCVDEAARETMKWVWLRELKHVMTAVTDLDIWQLIHEQNRRMKIE